MHDLSPAPGDLEPVETASRDEITALQLQRLRWALWHAYDNVPFYRRRFDEAGVHPDDCRELADLANYPFTVKQDFRDNYPFGLLAVPREQVARIHGSSGTTGKPTVVGYTRKDVDTWADLVARPSGHPAAGRVTSSTSPTATGCSPAGWGRITGPSGWAAPSSRCPAG